MKRIEIDVACRTEFHRVSGSRYQVDGRLERLGDAMLLDRAYVQHPEIAAAKSVILPHHHLWVLFFEGHGESAPYPCYMHMAQIEEHGGIVTITDLYLDVVLTRTGDWQVLDIDEFRAAIAAGELSPEQIQAALEGLEHACRAMEQAKDGLQDYVYRELALGGKR